MKDRVKQGMFELFNEYKLVYEKTPRSEVSSLSCVSSTCGVGASQSGVEILDLKTQYRKFKRGGRSEHVKSELEKYLTEEPEEEDEVLKFDILNWWKVNSRRFPILSKLARDILASPVLTVASESTFSTVVKGGSIGQQIAASISRSTFWNDVKIIHLQQNMRSVEDEDFSRFLLQVGDGLQRTSNGRAIITPKNVAFDKINEKLIDLFPGEDKVYSSWDSVDDD
ncbi:hypothetical protein BUALT_Bualt17G0022700 [Buddleja alternifolia]|uniref:HAT C-terminal dimerisation domain-containing protein n=1 Tax=Buddleja alternifolia TaxID=168488 RepID=A0AAV6WG06_9LAMI|nr:hypothetical protein BUALT_Bualt17G0022700 [Buddleja alternifolia]